MHTMKALTATIILLAMCLPLQARRCKKFVEFRCFWDGDCIPIALKCNGVHDCIGGEDESNLFAKCDHCPGKFHCHKYRSSTKCIDIDYTCDGFDHCWDGEDESYEFAGCTNKCKKDLEKAKLMGRTKCKRSCKNNEQCDPPGKICVCDYECGMSCVNIEKACPALETFPHLKTIRYVKRDRETKQMADAKPPYLYDVHAIHICEPGYTPLPDSVRMCHGRGNSIKSRWTREIVCAPACDEKDSQRIRRYKLSCGIVCMTDVECAAGESCTCDGPCGRSCVNLNVECDDVPPVKNAYIEYTGEKFDRVAHYICVEGTYRVTGHASRKCSGNGRWDGDAIVCEDVYCGNPVRDVIEMGGDVVKYSRPPYKYNTTLEFECGSGQRLLGSAVRTCMANGRWSGLVTVCDNIGTLERCPHPGIPVNGELVGSKSDWAFMIGREITFHCNERFVMIGDSKQKCLSFKQWSGDGSPMCFDPRYSDSPADVIRMLSRSTSNVRPTKVRQSLGRVIGGNPVGGHEVYFLIDLSGSMEKEHIRNMIAFARSLVQRLSINGTAAKIRYGIIVFATIPELKLDANQKYENVTDTALRVLDDIEKSVVNIRRIVQTGTDIEQALRFFASRQLAESIEHDKDKIVKRHIFALTDGKHTAGGKPTNGRRWIEQAYGVDSQEFYSITSAAASNDPEAHEELRNLASKDENFVYVEDFYKLHIYIDQVTDIREDYRICGQAGADGSVRKIVTIGRVTGGSDAAVRAWPWQALITRHHDDILVALNAVRGGGSLLSRSWVMTAAHLFDDYAKLQDGWWDDVVVTLGLIDIPQEYDTLAGSVRMFQPKEILIHPNYDKIPFDNDVALIRLGGEYIVADNGRVLVFPEEGSVAKLAFSPYIRPVCLPCSPDSCVSKVLGKPDAEGKVLLDGTESEDERCKIEYDFLVGKNSRGDVAVVGTGFGHLSNITHEQLFDDSNINTATTLQEVVLQIRDSSYCKTAVRAINSDRDKFDQMYFTDNMICGTGHEKEGRVGDTCKGDSGGPIAREVRDEATKKSCFVQLGIVSWGHGCAQSTMVDQKEFFYPGFYTDVKSVVPWLTKTMKEQE